MIIPGYGEWGGPHPTDCQPGTRDQLLVPVPGARWPYGPPPYHQDGRPGLAMRSPAITGTLYVYTQENAMRADVGDWIIKDANGDLCVRERGAFAPTPPGVTPAPDPTIVPFPELRAYAEGEAYARRQRVFDALTAPGMGFYGSELRAGVPDIAFWTEAVVAELCDLTRDASMDAVCRLIAQRFFPQAFADGGDGMYIVRRDVQPGWQARHELFAKAGVPRTLWAEGLTSAQALALIVRYVWPGEAK